EKSRGRSRIQDDHIEQVMNLVEQIGDRFPQAEELGHDALLGFHCRFGRSSRKAFSSGLTLFIAPDGVQSLLVTSQRGFQTPLNFGGQMKQMPHIPLMQRELIQFFERFMNRSEERRVGKECRCRLVREYEKKRKRSGV